MMRMDDADSRDEWVVGSQKRAEIDAAFGAMANDAAYRSEALMIAAEFSKADWEAFQLGESGNEDGR
jgi:hypothetical protein